MRQKVAVENSQVAPSPFHLDVELQHNFTFFC